MPSFRVDELATHDLVWVTSTNDRWSRDQVVIHLAHDSESKWRTACGLRLDLAKPVSSGSWLFRKCMKCVRYEPELPKRVD